MGLRISLGTKMPNTLNAVKLHYFWSACTFCAVDSEHGNLKIDNNFLPQYQSVFSIFRCCMAACVMLRCTLMPTNSCCNSWWSESPRNSLIQKFVRCADSKGLHRWNYWKEVQDWCTNSLRINVIISFLWQFWVILDYWLHRFSVASYF